ncbi:unnamed protein product [Bursaphelenchus okinawaensis]|uniref:SSD domain-containing protein n=1 Tax=Bursaphelenchus okinawaensis TaxID=465554 RepID=A0A811KCV8_9BILA|nr:unnamed protein product [Bursaphelenchus okinawaensis]CAG9099612.1 unnamed protein product [Bursaphelenchus okinawaensis]
MEDMELLIILIESKDRGASKMLLTSELLEEVVRLDNSIQATNITLKHGTMFSFKNLFTRRGSINFLFDAFKMGYDMQNLNEQLNFTLDSAIQLDSPFATIYDHRFLTLQHFFGADTYPRDNVTRVSQIKAVQSIGLWYMLQAPLPDRAGRDILHDIELKVFEMSQQNFSSYFDFYMYADEVANHEMMVGSLKTTNLLVVGAKDAAPVDRLERVVSDVGPSILITSVTNTLAFSVGILSPAYTMMSFCLCTTIAVALDLILEFAVFAPTLVIIVPKLKIKKEIPIEKSWWFKYATFLLSKFGRGLFTLTIVALSVWAYFGIANMNPNFEPEKTFPFDSYLQESLRPIKTLYKEYGPLSIIINKAPDVKNQTDLSTFIQMVESIEALPETYPSNYTQLWLRDYLKYFEKHSNDSLSYQLVPQFLEDRLMKDKNVVLYHEDVNGIVHIDSFVLLVICHGERNWHSRAFFVDKLRSMVDSHPEYKASVFDYDATIFDLIITAKPEMIKAVVVTLVCMVIVCFVIIPSPKHTGIATLSVLSISYSLIGALGWWGQDMDPVTMTNVLMAIGFSVDFSAHICYHYFKQERIDTRLGLKVEHNELVYRLTSVLLHVGRPTFEAASSTMICMLPLFTVKMYVIGSFAKTVICVGLLGVMHGLFLVPSLLTLTYKGVDDKKRLKETRSTDSDRPLISNQALL